MSSTLCAQYVSVTVNSKSRPVSEAIQQIQRLTTIPISYEDLQYNYANDLQDIGLSTKVLVPKGGSFSVDVPVDPATGKLPDALSVSHALSLVIGAAHAAGAVPGAFRVDSSQPGIFFVEPDKQHDANGATVAAQPVFGTPVTISFQETVARQVLYAIFEQVQQNTGVGRFMQGSVMQPSKVSITASNEPAKYVIARLLACGSPASVSYLALFGPQMRSFVFNMGVVAGRPQPNQPLQPTPPRPPPTGIWPGFHKAVE
jgi:hypothetical protein